ncbi:casein kinase II subunit alpha'-interacting protein [Mastomys coucha]|uniref:casein kinase II subunit alpha'-interacting protein n=1 Tax=Mastomys coucha TaxID=35658 RepID=UPI0012615B84|nr:casein kinase II subunit alpha'-interacting protein [Mastomys coucha]
MVPLGYNDKHFVYAQDCQQQATKNLPMHYYTGDKLNQPYSQPMCKEQSPNMVRESPASFNKKVQNFSALSPPNSKMTQGSSYNRAKKSPPLLYSKCSATASKDSLLKGSSHHSWKSVDSSLSHHKSQTTSLSSFTSTSSLEPSKLCSRSRLPLPRTQTSSSIDLCWKSPSLESNQRVSTSSSSLQNHEPPALNIIWTTPSLESSQTEHNSQLCKSKSQKDSSLDHIWSSLLESSQKALSSPSFTHRLQRNSFPPTPSSLEFNRVAQNSPLHECNKPLKIPLSNTNNNVLNLPLSQAKSRKSTPSSHYFLPSQSLSSCQPKPKIGARCNPSTRAINTTVCQPKVTASLSDKQRPRQLLSINSKPNISSQRISSPKPCIKNKSAPVPSSRLPNKCRFEKSVKSEPENEILWSLDYSHPCIIKGGSVPGDVVNKIVNSISKSTIQKDLSRQILFRRMRGKPNPRPGPRLSSTYSVCLDCASAIKSQCNHLTGKRDPRCATLFVIPTPESGRDGKADVKIVLILSLPEMPSSPCFQLPMKDSQSENNLEALDGNLDVIEKITQLFPASESDFIQGLKTNRKYLAVSPESKDLSQEPQSIDWLLYVKNSNGIQSETQVQGPSATSSSSCSSLSSSSSSSSTGHSSAPTPCTNPAPTPGSGYALAKVRSYHQLPPGTSWLEFIRGSRSDTTKLRQLPSVKTKPVSSHNTKCLKKGRKETSALLKYFQTKFQNEKS